MVSRRRERRRARECALALLYSSDITEQNATDIVQDGAYPEGVRGEGITISEYAEMLVEGVAAHLEQIDEELSTTSENWALGRMPLVDKAILRVAVFEMLYVDEVPVSVAINEAVDLAKMYGGEDESSRFVNGVLGRIARAHEEVANNEEIPIEEAPGDEVANSEEAPSSPEASEGSVTPDDAAEAVG